MAKKKEYIGKRFDWIPRQIDYIIKKAKEENIPIAQVMRDTLDAGIKVSEVQEIGYTIFVCSIREDLLEDVKVVAEKSSLTVSNVIEDCLNDKFKNEM